MRRHIEDGAIAPAGEAALRVDGAGVAVLVATFLKGVGMGVSDGAQAAHPGLAELANAVEEV